MKKPKKMFFANVFFTLLDIVGYLVIFAICTATIIIIFSSLLYFIFFIQSSRELKNSLEKIPNTKVSYLYAEYGNAILEIENKGTLSFHNLKTNNLQNPNSIQLAGISNYSFVTSYKPGPSNNLAHPQKGSTIDLGNNSNFSHLFPFKITSVQDVVTNYDAISAITTQWPENTYNPYSSDTLEDENFCIYSKETYQYQILEKDTNMPAKCDYTYDQTEEGKHRVKIYYSRRLNNNGL